MELDAMFKLGDVVNAETVVLHHNEVLDLFDEPRKSGESEYRAVVTVLSIDSSGVVTGSEKCTFRLYAKSLVEARHRAEKEFADLAMRSQEDEDEKELEFEDVEIEAVNRA